MESQPEERTAQEVALNIPIILMEILQRTSTPLKTCRLVSSFWNEIVLSLPNTRFNLKLNEKHAWYDDPSSFFALCDSLDDRLAKRISATCDTKGAKYYRVPNIVPNFAPWMTHFGDKFSDIVQIMELSIDDEDCFKYIYQVLKNCCPNLKRLQISYDFVEYKEILHDRLPPKQKLESFLVHSTRKTGLPTLTNFIQVVINASPNLKKLKIPWGCYPDLGNSTFLDSLTIVLDNLGAHEIARFEPTELLRMLNQIADQLVMLCFGEFDGVECIQCYNISDRKELHLPRKMPKLENYRNMVVDIFRCDNILQDFENMPALKTLVIGNTFRTISASLHGFLQTISYRGMVFESVRNLKIYELYDPTLLKGLKTAFPNLVSLEVYADNDKNEMEVGLVLKACGGWEGLKRFHFSSQIYPEPIKNTILALLEGRELYKGLKTLDIGGYHGYISYVAHRLTPDELDLFKELLLAMNGMDDVIIPYLNFSEESKSKIFEFMESNNLVVSKFRIFEGISLPPVRDWWQDWN